MRVLSCKLIAFILILSLMASALAPVSAVAASGGDAVDPATLMMVAAHARINGISDRDQLNIMKNDYRDYYDDLLASPDLDDDQKAQIIDIRDGKIAVIDEKISELEKAWRRKQRSWSPIGILGGAVRGGGKVIRGTGDVLGKGIQAAGNTVVQILRDPKQLLTTVGLMLATGGTSSFKDAIVTIVKSEVRRAVKKAAYAELARIAYENPALRKAAELKEFLGIKGNEDFDAALEEVFKKRQESEEAGADDDWGDIGYEGEGGYDDADAGDPDEAGSGDVGPEGEGGYDDADDATQEYLPQLVDTLEDSDRYFHFSGENTCTAVGIIPASEEMITAMIDSNIIWEAHYENMNIFLSPGAAGEEEAEARKYVNTPDEYPNAVMHLMKSGAEIEAEFSFFFFSDMVTAELIESDEINY